jgi:ribosome-associated protein
MAFSPGSFPQTPQEDEAASPPSKSRRKREMQALQDLGEQLAALPSGQLDGLALPEALAAALAEARRFAGKREALRRQMQYVGKLMRGVDPAPIRARLDALRGLAADEVARQHRLERLRDELIADEKTAESIARDWPGADIQRLRLLRRKALKERERQAPPKAYREIFKTLRELDAGA